MQRMTINIDLSDEEVLGEQINEMIQGAVRGRTKDFFNREIEGILRTKEEAFARDYSRQQQWGPDTRLERAVKNCIDKEVKNVIEKSEYDINYLLRTQIQEIVVRTVAKEMEKLDLEGLIRSEIRKILPEKIMEILENYARSEKN